PGRFLADAPAGERNCLVGEPRGLAAYPQLDQHKGGIFEGQVELVRDHELAVVPGSGEHPGGKPADDLATLGVRVLQDELVQLATFTLARETGHELRGIGGAAADDGELHRGKSLLVILLGTQTRRLFHVRAPPSRASNRRPIALMSFTRW